MSKPKKYVTILVITVLTFTGFNGLRLYNVFSFWSLFIKYGSRPGPAYLVVTSLFWIMVGLIDTYLLLTENKRSSQLVMSSALLYTGWFWIDRIFIQSGNQSILFPLIGTLFMLLFILILTRKYDSYLRIK